MTERIYDIDAANAALPVLRELLPRIQQQRRLVIEGAERISARLAGDGGGVAGTDVMRAHRQLAADLTTLAEMGVLLRDPEMGLVDFPAEREGRRVFLCWHVGEDEVAWFHEERGGFSRRRRWSGDDPGDAG